MSAARSYPPPAPGVEAGQLRPKALPLRAGPKRVLGPKRDWARGIEQPILARILAESGISNAEIAECFGNQGDKCGAEIRNGSTPITPGEEALLLPIEISTRVMVALIRERVGREIDEGNWPSRETDQIALLFTHLDSLELLVRVLTRSRTAL